MAKRKLEGYAPAGTVVWLNGEIVRVNGDWCVVKEMVGENTKSGVKVSTKPADKKK